MVMPMRVALAVAALTAALAPAASPAEPARPRGIEATESSALAAQVVAAVNSARADRGLGPLRISRNLTAAAGRHSREMAENGYFEHRSADGSAFWKRIARYYPAGRFQIWSVGENLLWSSPATDARGAVRMWMRSPTHRRNMFEPRWREIGISALHVPAAPGVYKGLDVTIVTADFGVRA
jgi:uncharacterized protein YkwD